MAPPHPHRRPSLQSDDTVRIASVGPTARRRSALLAAASGLIVIVLMAGLAAGVAWHEWRPAPLPRAGETTIFRHVGRHFAVFRFAPDPRIIVIDCPSLHEQGLMFDRIAALIEKSGAPHDRVLSETAFRETLTAADLTTGTYYYGDDYSARGLRKFFRLARAGGLALNPQETRLRAIAQRAGFLAAGAEGAIISIPQAGSGHRVGARARAVILRHELSHGAYFTDPDYRAFVHRFYDTVMTEPERAAFRTFLQGQGYDTQDHDLTVNETIAYLMFTRDPAYFRADAVGLPHTTIDTLRTRFLATMPRFWLRNLATTPLPSGK